MNKKISDKDKKDWDEFISSKESLPDKDEKLKKKIGNKLKTFDLHGYSLDEANKKIKSLIQDAYNKKIKKLIIVTGKGLHSQNEKDPYASKELGILKWKVFVDKIKQKLGEKTGIDLKTKAMGSHYFEIEKMTLTIHGDPHTKPFTWENSHEYGMIVRAAHDTQTRH